MNAEELTPYKDWSSDEITAELERLQTIDRFVQQHCRQSEPQIEARFADFLSVCRERFCESAVSSYRLAAATNVSECSVEEESEELVKFVFCGDDWRLDLTFPETTSGESDLDLALTDEKGAPVESARVAIAGVVLPIEAGHAQLPMEIFLAGMRETKVEVTWANGRRSPGGLIFF